ncbi:uncharacterized protein LOC117298373 [Asterias rubens]|uniref:uncharacterized protein LOC117298373 n=1 Tax=Asterias rubens TaxID=7604 RepID=UPI0014553569|nr:uncharacterized protein LOC117298373 [Asterias rubens]XP_033637493.1 uncharacterized protein LOC117298373 [Asterias rubens]XP_033637494.1 uncharacterized protein LOC117298373 [Asterias rubens]
MAAVHEAIQPLTWLLGHWDSFEANGEFPTIGPFTYRETLDVSHVGQPMLNFFSEAWDSKSSKALHRESGFIRIKPGTKEVAYICAQNIGLVDLEEGEVDGTSVTFATKFLCRMSFANEPETTEIKRTFCLKDDVLEQIVFMATKTTPTLTKHLHVKYRKETHPLPPSPTCAYRCLDSPLFKKMAMQVQDLWSDKFGSVAGDQPRNVSPPVRPEVTATPPPSREDTKSPSSSREVTRTPQSCVEVTVTSPSPEEIVTPLSPSVFAIDQPSLPLTPSRVSELKGDSRSEPNFALALVRESFTRAEMAKSNCRGVRGNSKLDPIKLEAVKRYVQKYSTVVPSKFQRYWTKECVTAIDEGCRRMRRKKKK